MHRVSTHGIHLGTQQGVFRLERYQTIPTINLETCRVLRPLLIGHNYIILLLILTFALRPQVMRHAGDRRIVMSSLIDLSLAQSRSPRLYADRLRAISDAITLSGNRDEECGVICICLTGATNLLTNFSFVHSTTYQVSSLGNVALPEHAVLCGG